MNERMTKRNADGQAMMDCEKCKADWTGKHGKPMADCTALYCRNRLLGRVVEYEDTGRTPKEVTALGELFNYALKESKTLTEQLTLLKRLRELAEADKDGRVVVLPCKVGDTLWVTGRDNVPRSMALEAPDIRTVCTDEDNLCMSTCNRKPGGFCAYRLRNDGTDIGKTVFLTREEAERAMQEMEGKKDGNETSM
mgnify:CR=1 FL=1